MLEERKRYWKARGAGSGTHRFFFASILRGRHSCPAEQIKRDAGGSVELFFFFGQETLSTRGCPRGLAIGNDNSRATTSAVVPIPIFANVLSRL